MRLTEISVKLDGHFDSQYEKDKSDRSANYPESGCAPCHDITVSQNRKHNAEFCDTLNPVLSNFLSKVVLKPHFFFFLTDLRILHFW